MNIKKILLIAAGLFVAYNIGVILYVNSMTGAGVIRLATLARYAPWILILAQWLGLDISRWVI